MNIESIAMDPRIATIHYKDYRKKVIQHRKDRVVAANALITEGNKTMRHGRSVRSQIEREDEVLMHSYLAGLRQLG